MKYNTPRISQTTKEFWEGLNHHKLLAPRCSDCNELFFPPRSHCPKCLSKTKNWVELSGRGTLYSWTEVFMDETPYIIGIVELAENIGRMISVIKAEPEDLLIGMNLRVGYEDFNDNLTLFVWEPDLKN